MVRDERDKGSDNPPHVAEEQHGENSGEDADGLAQSGKQKAPGHALKEIVEGIHDE